MKKKFKIYIKKLQKFDFTPICECIKSITSNLTERLNHEFNKKEIKLYYIMIKLYWIRF